MMVREFRVAFALQGIKPLLKSVPVELSNSKLGHNLSALDCSLPGLEAVAIVPVDATCGIGNENIAGASSQVRLTAPASNNALAPRTT